MYRWIFANCALIFLIASADLRLVDTELFIIEERTGEVVAFTSAKLGLVSVLAIQLPSYYEYKCF
jgi:hypothetical protein